MSRIGLKVGHAERGRGYLRQLGYDGPREFLQQRSAPPGRPARRNLSS